MEIVKVAKISSNDSTELIYIPKAIVKALGLRKGVYVKISVDGGRLIVEPLKLEASQPKLKG